MVVAGPGTGKTQIIAARTANIILKTGVNPSSIFITTFTEAGVIAIKERLLKFIGRDSYKVYVSTIHSFASDVIATFPEKFIEEKSGRSIDEIDGLQILKGILENGIKEGKIEYLRANGDDIFYLRDIKKNIDKLKQEAINPSQFQIVIEEQKSIYDEKLEKLKTNKRIRDLEKRTAKDKEIYDTHIWKLSELNLLYKAYQKYLREHELFDYNDMIQFVVEKFRADESLRSYYAEKFLYIMLNEYQDTNNAQNEIIEHICSVSQEVPNIMVVGDDDQSIYRFQGANIENMLGFSVRQKDVKIIVLEDNYRSTQAILDTATSLISNNSERLVWKISGLEKKLISHTKTGLEKERPVLKWPSFILYASDITEKVWVTREIKNLLAGWVSPQEIAIIVRGNREVEEWSEFLKSEWLEVESKVKTNILNSPYIQVLLDFISLVINPYTSEEKLIGLLRSSLIDVDNIDILKITRHLYQTNYVRKDKIVLFKALISKSILENIELSNPWKIEQFTLLISELQSKIESTSFGEFFNLCVESLGLIEHIEKNGSFDDLQDVYTLFNRIKDFGNIHPNYTIEKFLEKINLYISYSYPISRQFLLPHNSGVQILTSHGSKWLEYEAVFIPGLYSGNWEGKKLIEKIKLPNTIIGDGLQDREEKDESQMEEDRRLFFVALTRAKKHLFLSSPRIQDGKMKIISEFIEEVKSDIEMLENNEVSERELESSLKKLLTPNRFHTSREEELNYIWEFLKNYRLSVSDLNSFLEDPKIWLHRSVFKYPFVENEATIFWSIYHKTLEYFYKDYKKTGKWWAKKDLSDKFGALLAKEILTEVQRERLDKKWREWLEGYYDFYQNSFQEPFFVEYDFRPKNVIFDGIPLTGKIDKIVRITDTEAPLFSREEVAIVDYKTGAIKYRGEIKWIDKEGNTLPWYEKGKYFRQLLFYKLLSEEDKEFSSHYEVKKLMLDFAEWRGGKYSIADIDFSEEEYETFKILIKESWQKISSLDFWREIL